MSTSKAVLFSEPGKWSIPLKWKAPWWDGIPNDKDSPKVTFNLWSNVVQECGTFYLPGQDSPLWDFSSTHETSKNYQTGPTVQECVMCVCLCWERQRKNCSVSSVWISYPEHEESCDMLNQCLQYQGDGFCPNCWRERVTIFFMFAFSLTSCYTFTII